MKHTFFALTMLLLAATPSNNLDALIAAWETGNAVTIASHMNNNVEMSFKHTENVFTRQQAQTILSDFFKKNKPKKFTINRQERIDGQHFVIGILATDNGNYRIYFLTKNNLIQQIKIEHTND